ncbi:YaaR family protein [Clostridium carnis]
MENMEIGRVNRKSPIKQDRKIISEKRDFSQSFNQARERKSEEQLRKMIEDIKKRGNRLVVTKTYGDVIAYKKMIKEYLESILKFMYDTKKDISFWQTQYFVTVDTIDGKLEELTQAMLNEESENLNIAASIDEIQGLIVDIYR